MPEIRRPHSSIGLVRLGGRKFLTIPTNLSETRAGLCDDAAVVSRMQMYAKGKGLKQERAQEGLFRVSD